MRSRPNSSARPFLPSGEVTGSLCLVKVREDVTEEAIAALVQTAKCAAAGISDKRRRRLPGKARAKPWSRPEARL